MFSNWRNRKLQVSSHSASVPSPRSKNRDPLQSCKIRRQAQSLHSALTLLLLLLTTSNVAKGRSEAVLWDEILGMWPVHALNHGVWDKSLLTFVCTRYKDVGQGNGGYASRCSRSDILSNLPILAVVIAYSSRCVPHSQNKIKKPLIKNS